MAEQNSNYKYRIDKEAVKRFFIDEKPSKESIKAIHLVIKTVIIKHYIKYICREEDLISLCMVKLLEIKPRYDLSFPAYNYAYTACRNEIGNYLNKQRELIVEDILPIQNASVDPVVASLPPEINKFKKYLTGEKEFDVIELTPKEAINLALFCEAHRPSRKVEPPEYLKRHARALSILYRLILKI